MTSLPQSLLVRPVALWVPSFLSWKIGTRISKRAPIIHEEIVSDLIDHLDIHKSMGADGIQPRVLRNMVEVFTETTFNIYQQSWPMAGDVSQGTRGWQK